MNHFEITSDGRLQKQILLNRKLISPVLMFWAFTITPFLIYFAYSAGVFNSTILPPFSDLEAATALVSTSNGTGTAFLISADKLLTARHVVEDMKAGDEVNLLFERVDPPISTKATLKWRDDTPHPPNITLDFFLTDVAVLELNSPGIVADITPLVLGNSDEIPTLTPIIAIGYPGGSYSITRGDINNDQIDNKELFKIDAATNPGNSGGPVISEEDETVIGMLVGQRGDQTQGENISNKINNIRNLLETAGVVLD